MPAVTGFLRSRGDRIRTCGILLTKQFSTRLHIGHFAGLTPVLTGFYGFVGDRLRPY